MGRGGIVMVKIDLRGCLQDKIETNFQGGSHPDTGMPDCFSWAFDEIGSVLDSF